MGYRSQVRCLIYGEPDKLNALIVKHQLEGGKLFEDMWFGNSLKRYTAKRTRGEFAPDSTGKSSWKWTDYTVEVLDLEGDGWKWYPNYEDVIAWTTFMHSAHEFDCSYEFIRIGEEDADIEHESGVLDEGDYWLGVMSSITCDVESLGDA